MELIFNLIFAAIASAAFALLLMAPRRDERRAVQRAMLLVCVLALVFPFISISDDVSAAPDIAEGPTFSACKVQSTVASKEIPLIEGSTAKCVPITDERDRVVPRDFFIPSSVGRFAIGLRSPPL